MDFKAFEGIIFKEEVLELFKKYLNEGIFDETKAQEIGYNLYDKLHITYVFHILDKVKVDFIKDNFKHLDDKPYSKIEEFFERLEDAMTMGYGKQCVQMLDYLEDEIYGDAPSIDLVKPSYDFKTKLSLDFMTGQPQYNITEDPTSCEAHKIIENIEVSLYIKQNMHMTHNRLHKLVKYFYELLASKDVKNTYSIYWRMRYLNLLIVTTISLYNLKTQDELISKSLKLQERLTRFNRLLGEINYYINVFEDEKELFQKICDITIKFTNAKLSWIGKPDKDGKIEFLASAGEINFLDGLFISVDKSIPEGRGPSGIVWREKRSVFIDNFLESEHTKPWQERAKKFGIGLDATIPIFKSGQIYAIFNFYLPVEERFNDELKEILEEIGKDISYGFNRLELLRKERELSKLNEALVNNSTSGILIIRYPERIIEYTNKRFAEILGYEPRELKNRPGRDIFPNYEIFLKLYDIVIKDVLEKGYGKTSNIPFKKKDGSITHMDLSGIKLSDNPTRVVWTFVDVEDRYQLEKELESQVITDSLTGLPNRKALEDELKRAFNRSKRSGSLLAVCVLDLDNFKPINDIYGHEAGDDALKVISNRLKLSLRNIDFIARVGGDEFVVLIEDLDSKEAIYPALERIEKAVKAPISLSSGDEVSVGISIGVRIFDPKQDDINNEDELIRYADQAMYEAKAHKEDREAFYVVYGEKIKTKFTKSQELLYKGAVEVYYQPILDLRAGRIVGVEALARLKDEDNKIISPAVFLNELTEEDMFTLNSITMDKAIKDIKSLESMGINLWFSINVDPRNISDSCIECLKEYLVRGKIHPSMLTLEILESTDFKEQEEALSYIHNIKELGVKLALDDIGSAYSSLLRIKDLPIDKIKLDQAFVRTLEKNPKDLSFVNGMNMLARSLNIELVVEGVETMDILDALIALGVPMVQGYHIAKPMPFDALKEFLKEKYYFPRYEDRPKTLFGVYAQSIIHHDYVTSMIEKDVNSLNYSTLADYTQCKIHKSLSKILPQKDPILEAIHKKYHIMLAKATENMITNNDKIDWQEIDHVYKIFQDRIIEIYKKDINSDNR